MTGIPYGPASVCELKEGQNLEPKTKIGVTIVRPRQGQIQEGTGVEPKRQWGWEPNLEQPGTDTRTGTNPGEASSKLRNTSNNKAGQQGVQDTDEKDGQGAKVKHSQGQSSSTSQPLRSLLMG